MSDLLEKHFQAALYNGKHPGGRPRIKLTPDQLTVIERMASHGVSMRIVCDALGLAQDTMLDEQFTSAYKKTFIGLCDRLACAQVEKAIDKKDTIMQIWLGKQHLGQADKIEEKQIQIRVNVGSDYAQRYLLDRVAVPELDGGEDLPGLPAPELREPGPAAPQPGPADSDKE